MASQLVVKKFDMKSIVFDKNEKKAPLIIIIGRRDTGKSFLIRDLLYHQKDIPIGTVVSGIKDQLLSENIPQILTHTDFDISIIENVLKRQKEIINKQEMELEIHKKTELDTRAFLVLDNCMYHREWYNNELMNIVFNQGINYKLFRIISLSYGMKIPSVTMDNIDYVFILRDPHDSNRRRLYDNYADFFPNFESFCLVMDQCTENYECLVIDNNSKSNKLEDKVFWYKALQTPPFKMCSHELWKNDSLN
jgi:hypothetical protein